jgi:hypothetical protein
MGDYLLAGYLLATRGEFVSMSDCVVDLARAEPWDDWYPDAAAAEQARAGRPELHGLAVGMAAVDVPAVLAEVHDGSLPARLARGEAFPDSVRPLGFELVGSDSGTWHTWRCLGDLVDDVRQATGVQPGQWGLIQDEQDARRAAEWLTASNLGDPKVSYWVPALLADL